MDVVNVWVGLRVKHNSQGVAITRSDGINATNVSMLS